MRSVGALATGRYARRPRLRPRPVDQRAALVGGTIEFLRPAEGGTLVIPNQGRLYDEGDVAEYRDMLTIIRDRVQDAIGKGQTLEQIRAVGIARDYDGRYGAAAGPATPAAFLDTLYRSLNAPVAR